MKNWKHYPPNMWCENAMGFYQKEIYKDIFANVVAYEHGGQADFELRIQIPQNKSITGMTIDIINFTYHDSLNFQIIEKNAKQIIKALKK